MQGHSKLHPESATMPADRSVGASGIYGPDLASIALGGGESLSVNIVIPNLHICECEMVVAIDKRLHESIA